MSVRASMGQIISKVRLMIADPAGGNQHFADQDIQDACDQSRDDIRYEPLIIAPSLVNTASTGNQASTIFADYYSHYQWWEADATLQGYANGAAWLVLTPVGADYITGHWWFEATPFVDGTVPGQLPPVFVTGKVYDLAQAAADLCEMWAASLACAYDVTVDGQSLHRSQLMAAKLQLAQLFRQRAKPRVARLTRSDVAAPVSAHRMHLLDATNSVKGQ